MSKHGEVMEGLGLEIELRDKNGRLKSKEKIQSKSYVRNWLGILAAMQGASALSSYVKDTSGNYKDNDMYEAGTSNAAAGWRVNCNASSGDATLGILVGSSSTTAAPTDYTLGSQILHGTSSGQLSYGGHTIEDPAVATNDTTFRIIRTFTNNSTGTITVREICLVIHIYSKWNNSIQVDGNIMIIRDVLGTAKDIGVGETLTVRYIPKTTT